MPAVALAPTAGILYQAFTTGGLPLNGGLLYTYIAGGTTPQATYTTSAGTVQCANPIVLGADGRPPTEVWLVQGQTYRFDLYDSLSNLIASYDNISGINDFSGVIAASIVTTKGDLIVGTGVATVARLGVGTNGTELVADSSQTTGLNYIPATIVLTAAAGTNTITATASPIPSAYASGQRFILIPAATITGAATLNVSSLGAKNIFANGAACAGGELIINVPALLEYDGTQLNIIGPGIATGTLATTFTFDGSGGTSASKTLTYQKIGNFVTLNIPAVTSTTGTNSTILTANTALPAAFRPPSAQQRFVANTIINNAVDLATIGTWFISTGGIISLVRDTTTAVFTNGAAAGTGASQTITYYVG